MIDNMDKGAEETANNEIGCLQLQADNSQADSDKNDADILDTAAGQETLQVTLTCSQSYTINCRPGAKQKDKPANPDRK